MNLTLYNFLTEIKELVTGTNVGPSPGGGYLTDVDYSALFTPATASTVIAGFGTSTSTVATTLTPTASVIPSSGSLSVGPFYVPRDYDVTSDLLQFRFTGATNATVTEPIAAWMTSLRAPGSSTASTTAVQNATTSFTSGFYTAFAVTASGNGLAQGDCFYINLSTSTVPITVYGAVETYLSCLVAWDTYGNEKVGTSTQRIRG
jgi:hypothetical protein